MDVEIFCVFVPHSQRVYLIAMDNKRKHPIVILQNSVNSNIFTVHFEQEDMSPIFDFCIAYSKKYREVLPGSEYATIVPKRVEQGRITLTHNPAIDDMVQTMVRVILTPQTAKPHIEYGLAVALVKYKEINPN